MQLLDYTSFNRLNLSDFITNSTVVNEWEFMDENWTGMALGFTTFLRPMHHSSSIQSISLDLENLEPEVSWQIFEKLGLELEKGVTEAEIQEDFGKEFIRETLRSDRTTFIYLMTASKQEYYVSFTVDNQIGLVYFTIMNHPKSIQQLKEQLNHTL